MEELTIEEVIKYAVRVQQDSFLFYKRAAKRLEGNELKSLADELADHKVHHLRQLKKLLSECTIDNEDLNAMMDIDTTLFDEILESDEIPVQATPKYVLYLSLIREETTKKTYEMILNLPFLNEQMVKVFTMLSEMEKTHISDIQQRIERWKKCH